MGVMMRSSVAPAAASTKPKSKLKFKSKSKRISLQQTSDTKRVEQEQVQNLPQTKEHSILNSNPSLNPNDTDSDACTVVSSSGTTTTTGSQLTSSSATSSTSLSQQSRETLAGRPLVKIVRPKVRETSPAATDRKERRKRMLREASGSLAGDSYLSPHEEEEETAEVVKKTPMARDVEVEVDQVSIGATGASSAKRYRNSPFGLRRHYLTMPPLDDDEPADSSSVANQTLKFTTDEDDSDLDLEKSKHEAKMMGSKQFQSLNGQPYLSTANLNMAAYGHHLTSSSEPSPNFDQWQQPANQYHHHHTNQPKSVYDHHLDHFGSPAGLDAGKCNARMSDVERGHTRYQTATGGQQHDSNSTTASNQLQSDLHKLKLDELVEPTEEANSLLVRFSSIMYATFLVILGCILHVSELRQKSKNSSDHIYTTIVALVGIIWLLFLQADLQRYKRYATKYILIETIFNDHRQKSLDEQRASKDPSTRSTSSSSASLVNDRMSMNTEVIFKKTAYKMYQHRAALGTHHGDIKGHRQRSVSKLPDANDHNLMAENLVPAYKFLHGKMGANFYLKCGMAAFCFGHVIHEGLRFGQQVYFFGTSNVHCRDSAALIAHLITPLYSFYQLFMMFKYSNLVINRHKVLARFGLMHIIGTSVTFWFRTILEEAFEDFVHKMDYFKTNKPQLNLSFAGINSSDSSLMSMLTSVANTIRPSTDQDTFMPTASPLMSQSNTTLPSSTTTTMAQSLLTLMSSPISATITPQLVRHLPDSYACAQNTLLTTKSMNALPYLYPFTIEYNLLLAATFLSLYFNIGKVGHSTESSSCRPTLINYSHLIERHRQAGNSHASNLQAESSDNSSAIRTTRENMEKEEYIGEYKSNFVVNADCHSANKGLFCGFFVLLVTLVTIVIFFVTINKPTHIQLGIKINLIQEATLTTLILLVTLAGFKQVVKLNRNPYLRDKVTTDDVLMLIPLPFFFIHSLLSFRAETASMSASNSLSSVSSILLHGNNVNQQHDNNLMASKTQTIGNLQSILLSTGGGGSNSNLINSIGNNNNNNNNNNTRLSSSKLNNLLAGHQNVTNSRLLVVEESFISNNMNNNSNSKNGSRIMSGNNNVINSNNYNGNSNNNIIGGNRGGGRGGSGEDGGGSSSSSGGGIDGSNNSGNSSQIDHFKLITVALNIVVMIEVLVQTNFIIDGMRRCSESRYLRFKKPGRELITFAILLNITYWIVATFETKSVEQYKTEIEYYGPLPYMFISHTTLPVMLFYRYHSSVCLAEMWNRAYKPPKKR